LNGRDAFFLTGTDEHGNKIAEAAEAAGVKPQVFCDDIVTHYKKAWNKLDIEYDDFIRTTEDRHITAVQQLLTILNDAKTENGDSVIYTGTYEGMYCTGCEKFLTEKDLVDGVCPDHKKPPQLLEEKNYFFRLSGFLDKIKELIESNELLILPDERRREVLGLLNQELFDFSLSREKVKWGIPLPFDRSQVAYVWVEALSNYITAIGYGGNEELLKKWWYEAETVHLMAKDILKFHCIFWPAMLLAANLPLPNTIFLHGFFTVDGEKMSKTLGNQIDPVELVDQFGSDATRYLLLTQYPFGADGDIKRQRFVTKYNSDLANDLGNLVSRVAKMIEANFDGKLPEPTDDAVGLKELISETEELPEKVEDHINNFRISSAIDDTMNLVRSTNRFFDSNAPWKLIKEGEKKKAGGILYASVEVIRIIAIMLNPTMPNKTMEIFSVFDLTQKDMNNREARIFYSLPPGSPIKISNSIFPRIDEKKIEDKGKKEKKSGKKKDGAEGLIDIKEFGKVKMVVAEILEAEKVEEADKLLKIQIEIGSEKRQVIAGIAKHYAPDDLIGKKVVVVKNLKPAKIMGIESNGMLLAASKGKKLTLVIPDNDLPSGATIG
ncbi:MAG: methionine--tRNA ligase, partial [candidate division Zixibacteria bacterium]|nr:methionine--tRNA ligase [candidate division Zixibacteria bacterium]